MKHYGDITKINGAFAEPVNVIIGGSPCQDLSVAGKQKGIKHDGNGDEETTRSGLFIEQLRIIKEMRRNDYVHGRTGIYIRPRYMVWENVPGAFSTNKGADFRTVLEETVKVVCEKAPVVPIPKRGWPNTGCLSDVGGKWSVAWRVFDAKFWGVPQRRKRIALVADFGGLTAPEILFERESVYGNTEPGRPARENPAAETSGGTGAPSGAFCIQSNTANGTIAIFQPGELSRLIGSNHYWENGVCPTLRATGGDNLPHVMIEKDVTAYGICSMASNSMKSNNPHSGIYEAETARTLDLNGGNPSCNQGGVFILEHHPNDSRIKIAEDGIAQTLNARMGTGGGNVPLILNTPPLITATCGSYTQINEDLAATLMARDYKDPQLVCYPIMGGSGNFDNR